MSLYSSLHKLIRSYQSFSDVFVVASDMEAEILKSCDKSWEAYIRENDNFDVNVYPGAPERVRGDKARADYPEGDIREAREDSHEKTLYHSTTMRWSKRRSQTTT